MQSGWDRIEMKDGGTVTQEDWLKGFFPIQENGKRKWKRNFAELRMRDASLFAIGELEGKKVLDIGCGKGMYLMTFLRMGAIHVAGIDILDDYIEEAKQSVQEFGADDSDIMYGDCTNLPYEDNSFDLIYSGDVFEHIDVETKDKCIKEAYRVLKPGGTMTIKTPNLSYLRKTVILQRIKGLLTGKNPFNIHIAHTNNNPDNEHHGLTTHKEMEGLFLKNCFHEPVTTHQKLFGRGLPEWVLNYLKPKTTYNETIIMTARKPIFLGLYP